MTVWDLIVLLQHMPMDAEVEVHPGDGGFEKIDGVRLLIPARRVLIESDVDYPESVYQRVI
jgi:hypothetical protein